jgi:DtxR family Mn-dependent transcriptional regulator
LKIDAKTADDEACKMEHTLSLATLESLTDFMEFIQACPRAGESWLHYFEEFRRIGHKPENCEACAEKVACGLQAKGKPKKK